VIFSIELYMLRILCVSRACFAKYCASWRIFCAIRVRSLAGTFGLTLFEPVGLFIQKPVQTSAVACLVVPCRSSTPVTYEEPKPAPTSSLVSSSQALQSRCGWPFGFRSILGWISRFTSNSKSSISIYVYIFIQPGQNLRRSFLTG
jgi:hypothetical protein